MIEDTPENRVRIHEVADALRGTSRPLASALRAVFGDPTMDVEAVPTPLLLELDGLVMECEDCGWWCDTDELDDEQVCADCGGGPD
ncbi:MAG TPA: hypothetical protein VFE72_04025 [Lysobacter sp.]|nr:hypothetical protein [Lysobacter sp.]